MHQCLYFSQTAHSFFFFIDSEYPHIFIIRFGISIVLKSSNLKFISGVYFFMIEAISFLLRLNFFFSMCCFFINKIAPSISLLLLQEQSLFPIQLHRITKRLLVSWPRFHSKIKLFFLIHHNLNYCPLTSLHNLLTFLVFCAKCTLCFLDIQCRNVQ